jgi:predicted nucleic acid-binding protein
LWESSLFPLEQRIEVFEGFLSVWRWVEVLFARRPNLPDETDDHLVEPAVAGNAKAIVTRNTRDLARRELRFPSLNVLTPEQCPSAFRDRCSKGQ